MYKLLEAREKKKMGQEEVAHAVGISLRHYQYIERRQVQPTMTVGLRICNVLGIDPYDVNWTPNKSK